MDVLDTKIHIWNLWPFTNRPAAPDLWTIQEIPSLPRKVDVQPRAFYIALKDQSQVFEVVLGPNLETGEIGLISIYDVATSKMIWSRRDGTFVGIEILQREELEQFHKKGIVSRLIGLLR